MEVLCIKCTNKGEIKDTHRRERQKGNFSLVRPSDKHDLQLLVLHHLVGYWRLELVLVFFQPIGHLGIVHGRVKKGDEESRKRRERGKRTLVGESWKVEKKA